VKVDTDHDWVLYVNRWLGAPIQQADGRFCRPRDRDTPPGFAVSPVLLINQLT